MEFINYFVSNLDFRTIGISLIFVGCFFLFMPKISFVKVILVNYTATAKAFRSQGKELMAKRIEEMLQDIDTRLPKYSKALIVVGVMVTAYSMYHAL